MKKIDVSKINYIVEKIKKQNKYFISPYIEKNMLIDEEIMRTRVFNYEWIVYENTEKGLIVIIDNPKKPLLINYSEIIYIGELNYFINNFKESMSFVEEQILNIYKKDVLIFLEDIIYNHKLIEIFKNNSYKKCVELKNEFNRTKDIMIYHKRLVTGGNNELRR